MNSKVTKGTERSAAARQDPGRLRRDPRPADQPSVHDPEAEALLRRFLSEVHSYRQIGNAALRDLESRLMAMSRRPHPHARPEPQADDAYYAPPASARAPAQRPAPAAEEGPTLDERLQELSSYLHAGVGIGGDLPIPPRWRDAPPVAAAANARPAAAPRQPQPKPAPTAPILDRAWFEERFAAMRASIDEAAGPLQRLDALEAQFRQLMERLEAREARHSGLGPVEDSLKRLAAYLEDSKQWNIAHDKRVRGVEQRLDHLSGLVAQSHAAIAATAKGLEIVARGTGPQLAEATADLVAKRVEEKIVRLVPARPMEELSQEVSALSMHTRQSARSVDERLKQLQASLDEGLIRREEEPRPAERAKPRQPSADSIEKYLAAKAYEESDGEDYNRELIAAAQRAARLAEAPRSEGGQEEAARYQIPYGEFLPEEERRNSHLGLIVAAVILLLASAAMLYLNLRDGDMFRWQRTSAAVSAVERQGGGEMVRAKQPARLERTTGGASAKLPAGVVLSDDEAVQAPQTTAATPKGSGSPASLISTDAAGAAGMERSRNPAAADAEKSASIREAAVKGDRDAQFSVGQSYLTGRDAGADSLDPEDRLSKAARWFRRAAEGGHAASQYRLATLYELGQGAPKDLGEAENWYRRAAVQGHVKSMHNLAVLAVPGRGKQANYLTAVKWFSMAAAYGLPDSQYNLAVLYERGLGVARDLGMAYQWYALAVRSGDANAAARRDAVARNLTPEERKAVEAVIARWSARTADPAINRAAPEPPANPEPVTQAAANPEAPRAQVMKAAPGPVAAAPNPVVTQVQRHLERLGYKPGPVDGIPGPRTAAAIREFETRQGLAPAGQVTDALLIRLAAARS